MTKILYVEDNDDNVYMLKMRFEMLDGFEVLIAEDGEIGCQKAVAEMPDVILMDLDLPVVDGWQATSRLKADQKTRKIPIIALTAHAMAGSREKALAAGCDEFDTKPIEFDRLMQKINFVAWKKLKRLMEKFFSLLARRGFSMEKRIIRGCPLMADFVAEVSGAWRPAQTSLSGRLPSTPE